MNITSRSKLPLHWIPVWIPALALACAACNSDGTATTDATGTDSGETDSGETDSDGSDSGVDVPDPNPNAEPPGDPPLILRIDDTPPEPITINLDKEASLLVFGERAKDVTLIEIDSTQMLTNALEAIRDACGDGWVANTPTPWRDCDLTELGQRFPQPWEESAEFSVVRLLTLTPANANMIGTELEDMQTLVNSNPDWFDGGFGEILRNTLKMASVTDPLLPMPAVVESAKNTLLASHPRVPDNSGVLQVSLWDALHDMTPLQLPERFGPAGGHPGVLMPDAEDNPDGFVTKSDALTDAFSMRVSTGTRHRRVDGIDLSKKSGGDMFIVPADELGKPALAFDFDNLEITGIADPPTIDMRLKIYESMNTVTACTDDEGCYDNAPCDAAAYADPWTCDTAVEGSIWRENPWLFEYFAAWAGRLHYTQSLADGSYECFGYFGQECLAGALIGDPVDLPAEYTGGPIGWTQFILHDIFDPDELSSPAPQFFWELLVSIADHAFHDPDGDGVTVDMPSPVFEFKNLGLGVSADELIYGSDSQLGVVDYLKQQEDILADIMVGQYWRNNAALDLYFARGEDGQPYLVFANEEDLRADPGDPNAPYAPDYPVPGFFDCSNLLDSCKVSSKQIAGVSDTSHEKLLLTEGWSTLYVRDDRGDDYELRVYRPPTTDSEIVVEFSKL